MKFQAKNEIQNFSFDDAVIEELKIAGSDIIFSLKGAVVKADNSQNARYQDMACGAIVLQLENAEIMRVIKEGYKYYDADGKLMDEVPNTDVPAVEQSSVIKRCGAGTIFTTVAGEFEGKPLYEFGIDVPKQEDEEEVDTYWLCIRFENSTASWERYLGPESD